MSWGPSEQMDTPQRRRKPFVIGLALSIALNVFLVGVIGAHLLHSRREPPHVSPIDKMLTRAHDNLSPEDAATMQRIIEQSRHMVFAGPPGTGKTTVARLMGAILAGIGILSRGQVIETNRNGLVGEYIGHSGPKTEARLREARGGVLFIDEAYGLCPKGKNDFGDEVINTLLKYLEDCRADLVVIVAGYDAEMRKLLQSNKGLASRFPFTFHFEDYTPAELRRIFNLTLEQHSMMLTPGAGAQLDLLIADLYQRRDPEEWANGREMRRLCESVFRVVAARVRRIPSEPSDDDLRLVTEDDIVALRATALA